MKYLSVQREKSRKYSQSWQRQHATDELKTVAKAVNYLSERGISTLDELDAALSSVSEQADAIREGMKTAEKRMKELQKLIEYGKNYTEYKPIHDELKKLKNGWTNKRDKYEEAHRAELTLWNAASRYLHANLPKGTKPPLPISEWEKEYATLSGQRTAEYTKLKETRAEVAELHNIRKCVDIALKADQPEQTRTKQHEDVYKRQHLPPPWRFPLSGPNIRSISPCPLRASSPLRPYPKPSGSASWSKRASGTAM